MSPLIPQFGCEPVAAPEGCEWLFNIGDQILQGALTGLGPYLPVPDSPCDGFQSYVSLGQPPADLCDVLGVWLMGYGPTSRSARRMQDSAGLYPEYQTEWSVDLWERCYPGPTEANGTVELPDPDLLHDINRWVYQHGMAMYHGVIDALKGGPCETVVVGNLRPFPPQGGCAGWTFSLSIVA